MASYRAEVLADSPALYWAGGYEAGGTHCWDESGNGRHGTYSNTPTFGVEGPLTSYPAGKAIGVAAASSERITSTYGSSLFVAGQSITMEGWFYRVANATSQRLMGTNGANATVLLISNEALPANIVFGPGAEPNGTWVDAWTADSTWTHVALVFNDTANTAELFINGESKGSKTVTGAYGAVPGSFVTGPSVAFNGRVAHVALYPSALAGARIKAHYDAAKAAPVTPSKRIYWGALMEGTVYAAEQGDSPYLAKTTEEFETHAGRKPGIIHSSDPWLEWNGYGDAAGKTHSYGAIMLKSIGSSGFAGGEDLIEEVIAGTHDAAIKAWAQAARAWGRPFFFRLWWEMNGTWYIWGRSKVTAAQYKEAWKRFHGIAAPIAKNATWVWCPNVQYGATEEAINASKFATLYPGDAYVDWVGLDGYNSNEPWRGTVRTLSDSMAELATVAPSKPAIICETSSVETGGTKADWYRDLLGNTLREAFPQIKGYVHYNNDAEKPYDIESSEPAQNAFKAGIESQLFVNPTVAEFNEHTKIVPYGDPLPEPEPESSVGVKVNGEFQSATRRVKVAGTFVEA